MWPLLLLCGGMFLSSLGMAALAFMAMINFVEVFIQLIIAGMVVLVVATLVGTLLACVLWNVGSTVWRACNKEKERTTTPPFREEAARADHEKSSAHDLAPSDSDVVNNRRTTTRVVQETTLLNLGVEQVNQNIDGLLCRPLHSVTPMMPPQDKCQAQGEVIVETNHAWCSEAERPPARNPCYDKLCPAVKDGIEGPGEENGECYDLGTTKKCWTRVLIFGVSMQLLLFISEYNNNIMGKQHSAWKPCLSKSIDCTTGGQRYNARTARYIYEQPSRSHVLCQKQKCNARTTSFRPINSSTAGSRRPKDMGPAPTSDPWNLDFDYYFVELPLWLVEMVGGVSKEVFLDDYINILLGTSAHWPKDMKEYVL